MSTPITLPGLAPFGADEVARLWAAYTRLGPDYVPRTHHLAEGGRPRFINPLIFESSPYLLQHAHNPVFWHAWGEEAFALAAKLDRPILLSVGYSTCHWCHVMERESFEDEEIAAFINTHFVAIKVDREERPDVDAVYMTAVQAMTGRGGWPMTVVMTPDKRPFFGGTYFPPRDGDRGMRAGFFTILKALAQAYQTEREKVLESAADLTRALARAGARPAEGLPGPEVLVEMATQLAKNFDPRFGGFGRAPKFPRPALYEQLLRYARRAEDPAARHMVAFSLAHMAGGGMYDQIGGGFARYSTDDGWLVPHFEKMLYDNAQLVSLAVATWQATGDARFEAVANDTLAYVLREMTSPEGAFYSATDADSEGEEGKFFVWTPAELTSALGAEDAEVASVYYGVTKGGNFEGKSILYRPRPEAEVAELLGISQDVLQQKVRSIRARLYEVRKGRIPPLLDDKILTEWNGQMISALAQAGWAFGDPKYLAAATRAAEFVLAKLQADGRLLRTYRGGEARHAAVLEDYAFFISALLDLFEATAELRWLDEAVRLQADLQARFWDDAAGGYFATASDAEALLIRDKPSYDGAQPSGNSVAALNLLRLYELTQDEAYRARAQATVVALGSELSRQPTAVPKLAQALDWLLDSPKEVAIVTTDGDDGEALQAVLRSTFVPNRVALTVPEARLADLAARVPWLEGKRPQGGRATAYVCRGQVCERPTSDPEVFRAQLAEVERLEAEPLAVPGYSGP
ncbi:MAG: thioredoxin domain-containing protein [Deltaproteobacteria bacterium]|nr:thioredoxin domain-containing protein [Deltaproteobacteria bacterium]